MTTDSDKKLPASFVVGGESRDTSLKGPHTVVTKQFLKELNESRQDALRRAERAEARVRDLEETGGLVQSMARELDAAKADADELRAELTRLRTGVWCLLVDYGLAPKVDAAIRALLTPSAEPAPVPATSEIQRRWGIEGDESDVDVCERMHATIERLSARPLQVSEAEWVAAGFLAPSAAPSAGYRAHARWRSGNHLRALNAALAKRGTVIDNNAAINKPQHAPPVPAPAADAATTGERPRTGAVDDKLKLDVCWAFYARCAASSGGTPWAQLARLARADVERDKAKRDDEATTAAPPAGELVGCLSQVVAQELDERVARLEGAVGAFLEQLRGASFPADFLESAVEAMVAAFTAKLAGGGGR